MLGWSLLGLAHEWIPGEDAGTLLIRNATLHTVTQGTMARQDMLIADGVIKAMGQDLDVPDGATVINGTDKHIWPGLIALNTTAGLIEIEAVRATNDIGENARFTPEVASFNAFNADSALLPTLRSNGITDIEAVPHGGMVSGSGSLLQLDGWNAEDALVVPRTGLHVYWPQERINLQADAQQQAEQKSNIHQQLQDLEQFLLRAQAYASALDSGAVEQPDTRLDAMYGVFRGDLTLFIHADDLRQIQQAISLMDRFELNWVLVGGYDAWRIADELKARNIVVVYTHAQGLPASFRADEPVDAAYVGPKHLAEAGVTFALAPAQESWSARNLVFLAGQAIAYGVDPDVALAAVTQIPANLTGVGEQQGSLAVGKAATLIMTKGDLFDFAGGRVEMMLIDGRKVELNDRQKTLYHKYQQRSVN